MFFKYWLKSNCENVVEFKISDAESLLKKSTLNKIGTGLYITRCGGSMLYLAKPKKYHIRNLILTKEIPRKLFPRKKFSQIFQKKLFSSLPVLNLYLQRFEYFQNALFYYVQAKMKCFRSAHQKKSYIKIIWAIIWLIFSRLP